MSKRKISRLIKFYSWLAGWYDPLKKFWNKVFSRRAEQDLSKFLKANLDGSKTVLELGCGTAANLEKIFELGLPFPSYLGVDITPSMLEVARNKFSGKERANYLIEFRESELHQFINEMARRGEKYDIIVCTWVLSHLDSPSEAVNRAQILLAEEGKMFLIFATQPRWYINFWLYPLFKLIFAGKYVSLEEINKFQNVEYLRQYASGTITSVLIRQ